MNKECRDELRRMEALDYNLFLHILLMKEEKARREIRRFRFKYLTYKEGDNCMNKLEAKRIIAIIEVAKKVGERAGEMKLKELQKAGPRWNVVDERKNKVVDQMLDVCGFAYLSVPGRGKIVGAFKRLGTYEGRMQAYEAGVNRSLRIWKGYPSGYTLSMISTGRQEMSVNEAAVKAASEFLNENHLECGWSSRID